MTIYYLKWVDSTYLQNKPLVTNGWELDWSQLVISGAKMPTFPPSTRLTFAERHKLSTSGWDIASILVRTHGCPNIAWMRMTPKDMPMWKEETHKPKPQTKNYKPLRNAKNRRNCSPGNSTPCCLSNTQLPALKIHLQATLYGLNKLCLFV